MKKYFVSFTALFLALNIMPGFAMSVEECRSATDQCLLLKSGSLNNHCTLIPDMDRDNILIEYHTKYWAIVNSNKPDAERTTQKNNLTEEYKQILINKYCTTSVNSPVAASQPTEEKDDLAVACEVDPNCQGVDRTTGKGICTNQQRFTWDATQKKCVEKQATTPAPTAMARPSAMDQLNALGANDLATAGARAANHKDANNNCIPGTKLNTQTNVCELVKQGPFPDNQSSCHNGSFIYFKNLPNTLKSEHETNFKEWQNACKSLASCKNASEMTWHVTYHYDNNSESYGCIPKTCLDDFPKKTEARCEAFNNGEECTPLDTNASKGIYSTEHKTCEATECKDTKNYDLIEGKCVSKKQQKAQAKAAAKAETKAEKQYESDINGLIEAYNTVMKKFVSDCNAKGKTFKDGKCNE